MRVRVETSWVIANGGRMNAVLRYAMVERIAQVCGAQGLTLLAFGLGERSLRLFVDGALDAVGRAARMIKAATRRALGTVGVAMRWECSEIVEVPAANLAETVGWVHRVAVDDGAKDPLASPWTSHRDLMGYRLAGFYDPAVLVGQVDPVVVHALAGGRALPDGWPPAAPRREPLGELLRVAAAVLGVLPADRRCFGLFVQLARHRGWSTLPLANALTLTTRRVRQLGAEPARGLELALATLADPRLATVP